jgi:hypothetical protein
MPDAGWTAPLRGIPDRSSSRSVPVRRVGRVVFASQRPRRTSVAPASDHPTRYRRPSLVTAACLLVAACAPVSRPPCGSNRKHRKPRATFEAPGRAALNLARSGRGSRDGDTVGCATNGPGDHLGQRPALEQVSNADAQDRVGVRAKRPVFKNRQRSWRGTCPSRPRCRRWPSRRTPGPPGG